MKQAKTKKANILHLLYNFNVGGAERLIVDLLTSDTILNKTNSCLVLLEGNYNETLVNSIKNKGVEVIIFPKNVHKQRLNCLFKLLNLINSKKIDIIHTHGGSTEKWAFIIKLIKPDLKNVCTVHDTKILPNLNKINKLFLKHIADKVIAVSDAVYRECTSLRYKNALHINNCIKLNRFNLPKQKQSDVFEILNVSRIMPEKKGQAVLIQALHECKKRGLVFKCSFAGGPIENTKALKDLAGDLNVEFLGNREDVPQLLASVDLFVLPSFYEGLPLVLLEAMASKTPVIASDIESNSDLVEDYQNGILFKTGDFMDLADKIMYAANNPENLSQIKDAAYKFVQDFDISVMSRKYTDIYEEIL